MFDDEPSEQVEQALPDGPITLGIDGGYVRAAHKEGFFEVIAGRSVVAFRRAADDEVPESKCFGYVQTYDEKPRRRLWELMKSQGLQDNQQVVFMSDGGEDVRRVQTYLHPGSEHWIDWFHITMRSTVLQQQTKSLQGEVNRAKEAVEWSKRIDSVKHLLWHGNVAEALDRMGVMLLDMELIRAHSAAAEKLTAGMNEFETYIPQQPGVHPELRRAVPAGREDQHGVRGVDDQSSGESALCQETTDAVVAEGRAPAITDPDEGAQQ